MAPRTSVRVQEERFTIVEESERLLAGLADVGALVTFSGLCRSEGGRLKALELEHYPEMTEAELTRIVGEAVERWPIQALGVVHRVGVIPAGEEIVLVIAASSHRAAAFEAAEFVMDFLKTDAPFWKKEHPADGSATKWVDAKSSDDAARARWQRKDAAE